ncbi:hypothetical protein A2V49_00110 [candidate division WWE3 bacterium RBG_19FT_COMBO_34_6]|uniref:SCP domain-containing protein n=1 Tax=candidate division WWE3 bacterium RBG_19FT_COMBO_34_6 TaxID=1802612 RepID=A0A1F4UJM3_UNCKA|nr:MAG: hypothetical protein A2V49_00110 [candidate division WWE3 bacterium RBG_19FT_COMBO_34_6]
MMLAQSLNENEKIDKYRFIYHFIPHKTYRTRAHLLTHHALLGYCLGLFFVIVTMRFLPKITPGILGYASNIRIEELLRYTNEERAKHGLKSLKLNGVLSSAAENKANDMFKIGYWSHVSPTGTKPWDFILGEGYDYVYAGENLAKNFSNSKDVVQAWYESPSHKENLLSANYDDIGFAIVNGVLNGYETTLVVQMFGRSKTPSLVASANKNVEITTESISTENTKEQEIPPPVSEPDSQEGAEEPSEENYIQEPTIISNRPIIDVNSATKSLSIVFGGFIVTLLGIDVWYTKKHGILKLTGHTWAHLLFLAAALIGIMLSIFPGAIL